MTVYPDYTSSKTHVDIDIVCKIKIRKLISIGVTMALTFLKERKKAKKKAVRRVQQKAENAAQAEKYHNTYTRKETELCKTNPLSRK